jgi:hypothetical protein
VRPYPSAEHEFGQDGEASSIATTIDVLINLKTTGPIYFET